ncbi:MAG: MBL fold metallo-hydrolase [Thermoguttaceae bacterium]
MLVRNPPVAVTENLFMLGTNEYPVYLFRIDREAAIFEGSIAVVGPLVRDQMARLAIAPESVKQLLVTHAHPDHVMAVPLFRRMFPEVSVAASETAAKTLAAEKALSLFRGINAALADALRKAGRIPEDCRAEPPADNQIAVDRILKQGDSIHVGTARFQVLETPGHSPCSLSFFEPAGRILLVSDATGYYMPEEGTWWPNYFGEYAQYLESIERLAGLGAEVLCLAHNAVVRGGEDVAAYFRDCLEATRQYHRRIIQETQAGKSVRQIAEMLGSEAYQKTPVLPLDFFQKNCSLLVKLSLRHEGIEAT